MANARRGCWRRWVMAAVVTFATSTLAEGAVRQRLPVRLPTVGVLALFRDEAMYLTEWLTHYAAEGVTQFVLLENQLSVDNSVELVHRFAQQNPWLNVSLHTAREPRQQNRHYARHLHRVTTDWVLIVDLDEFAYARRGFKTLPHFLLNLTAADPTVGLVAIPWKVFGAKYQVWHPISIIANATVRHNIGKNLIFPGHKVEYKSLLCLSAVRAHLGLEPDAALVEELLPVGPTSFPEIDLHHSIEGLRAVFPDGTRLSKHRGMANEPNASKVGGLTPAFVERWPVHLNHYRLGSCEFWYRVKLMRGGAADVAAGPAFHRSWAVFQQTNYYANRVPDRELRRKRGGDMWAAALAAVHREWPQFTKRSTDPANGQRSLPTAPQGCQALAADTFWD